MSFGVFMSKTLTSRWWIPGMAWRFGCGSGVIA